ncbi:MAG: FKBP-type peptidyl-prolyl cis-trans isomerase [Actinomycetota bacterium]|nr:FKBP-type peptidyl-prolyl cis-trans isomerase [Actinomycetota bacterium]
MRTRKIAAALLVPALLALSACGDEVENGDGATDDETSVAEGDEDTRATADGGEPAIKGELAGVDVSGALDEPPAVTVESPPFEVQETTAEVIEEGTSEDVVQESDSVAADYTVVNGRTGKELESSYTSGQPTTFDVSEGVLIPGVYRGLLGQQAGGRVAVAIPPVDAFGETGNPQIGVEGTDTLIFVFDITEITEVTPPLEMAEGTEVDPPADVPSVVTDDEGVPTGFEATEQTPEDVTELGVDVIIEGDGPTVQAGQSVTVHYLGQVYPEGTVFDQSWERGEPFVVDDVGQAQVIAGWNEGLVGLKVGSRVILTIPADKGYGEQGSPPDIPGGATLLFVIDVLGVSG